VSAEPKAPSRGKAKAAGGPTPVPVPAPEAASVEPGNETERWAVALDALAERVAALVQADRSADDVADHQRGRVFPTAMILRRAQAGAPEPAAGMIPWRALPETLTDLGEYLPLDATDLAILLIASAPALDPRFEHFYVVLNNDVDARGPMVSTVLRLAGLSPLDAEARQRLRKDGPLQMLGLIDVGPTSRSLLSQVVTVPERVIAHLLGNDIPDPLLTRAIAELPEQALPDAFLPEIQAPAEPPVVLRARAGTAAIDQARRLALAESGGDPIVIDLAKIDLGERPDTSSEVYAAFMRSCLRESALSMRIVVIDARRCGPDTPIQEMLAEFDYVGAPVILLVDARRTLGPWERRVVTLPLPSVAQRREWWAHLAPEADGSLASTATHLDPQDIRDAASGSESAALSRVTGQTRRSRVQTVKPALRLSDVILDERPARMLRALSDRVRYRSTVLDEWGMRPGGARGRGVTALFAGPAGTGKTMSGEALAGELGVPLFVVDLASVVDKYIGETEKNLEDVFRTVENEDGVLLFDEADALFGKRSDVSDARDRYANIEVAYLLQRIEAFDGLAILTTNLRANLDEAFQRRLDMIVDFPEPEPDARKAIWAAALGPFAGVLTDEDCAALATLDITGGYIRAAMVSAAYIAAAQGEPLQRRHVLEGVREEWRKAGRLNFPDATFTGWRE
jgi:AAA+ superfamily predicted ATPase